MKNFSDLLDINLRLPVMVRIQAIVDNGLPGATIAVNRQVLFQGSLSHTITRTTWVSMLEPFDIDIVMSDKIYSAERETAIEILDLEVGNHALIPRFNHLVEYINDHNQPAPGNYLGFNGVWSLKINQPFYRWLHHAEHQGWLLEPVVF